MNVCKIFAQKVVNKENSGISAYYFELNKILPPSSNRDPELLF